MKETDTNATEVFSQFKIVNKILSVAGATGSFFTAINSSHNGGIVTWNACSDPTPGSVNPHNCKLIVTVVSFHPYHEVDFYDAPAAITNSIYSYIRLLIMNALYVYFKFSDFVIENLMREITHKKAITKAKQNKNIH